MNPQISETNINEFADKLISPPRMKLASVSRSRSECSNESMRSLSSMNTSERQAYTRRVKKVVEDKINQTLPRVFLVKLTDV